MNINNLWYFWDGPPIPPICSLGLKSLIRHSKGFDIHPLNSDNIKNYITLPNYWKHIKKWAHKADYIRPRILHKYGGIFVDVDSICLENLDILTNILQESKEATLMADEMSMGRRGWVAVGLLVAKPQCPILYEYSCLQDDFLKKHTIQKWHAIGGNLLNKCKLVGIHKIKYQRPFPVKKTRRGFLSKNHWSKFVRKTKGIPKPIIWPICFSSHFNCAATKNLTEEQWLTRNYMISSAFRYALGLEKTLL